MSKAWLVDADGTLWKTPVIPSLKALAEHYSNLLNVKPDTIYSMFRSEHRSRLIRGMYLDAYNWHDIVESVFSKFKVDIEEVLTLLNELLEKYTKAVKAYNGSIEALRKAKEHGYRIMVISNALYKYIKPPAEVTGVFDIVDAIVTPDTVSYYWAPPIKPFRPIFLHAMRTVPSSEYVMIGDNPLFDCIGALRSGINKVYLLLRSKSLKFDMELVRAFDSIENIMLNGSISEYVRMVKNSIREGLKLGEIIIVRSWSEICEAEGI